ncbi:MAG: GGDEF domain-containing protein [Planctomycetota bacterium]
MSDPARPESMSGGSLLYRRLDEEVARAARHGLPLCCVVFRMDGGAVLDDAAAQRLTRAATLLARRICRQSDVVAAMGPGCFGVVANASGQGARVLARSVAAELDALDFLLEGQRVPIEVRYGLSCLSEPMTAREMLEEARAALDLHVAGGIEAHC